MFNREIERMRNENRRKNMFEDKKVRIGIEPRYYSAKLNRLAEDDVDYPSEIIKALYGIEMEYENYEY